MAGRLSAALAPLEHLRETASWAAVQPPFIGEPRSGSETLDTVFIRCYQQRTSLRRDRKKHLTRLHTAKPMCPLVLSLQPPKNVTFLLTTILTNSGSKKANRIKRPFVKTTVEKNRVDCIQEGDLEPSQNAFHSVSQNQTSHSRQTELSIIPSTSAHAVLHSLEKTFSTF